MSTASTIVMRARVALKAKKPIEIEVPEGISSIQFQFMDGHICNSIESWFDSCIQNGLSDIKISCSLEELEVNPFGPKDDDQIVCIWSDNIKTAFSGGIKWENGYTTLEFLECEYKEDKVLLYDMQDITIPFIKNLKELKALSDKIGYEYFGDRFEVAYNLLDHSVMPNHDNIPNHLKDLPEDMKTIMLARSASYVFGGMGSWNDDPVGKAQKMGLEEEYDRLTNELIINQKKALIYVTNEC